MDLFLLLWNNFSKETLKMKGKQKCLLLRCSSIRVW